MKLPERTDEYSMYVLANNWIAFTFLFSIANLKSEDMINKEQQEELSVKYRDMDSVNGILRDEITTLTLDFKSLEKKYLEVKVSIKSNFIFC